MPKSKVTVVSVSTQDNGMPAIRFSNGATMKLTRINSDIAKSLVSKDKRSPQQRNLRRAVVLKYAEDMIAGKWEFNAAPLIFDKHRYVRDGQHRLEAVIVSDTEQLFWCYFDAPESVIDTVDLGLNRSFADILKMDSRPYTATSSAVVRYWWDYENGKFPYRGTPSVAQMYSLYELHSSIIVEAAQQVQTRKTEARILTDLATTAIPAFVYAYVKENAPEYIGVVESIFSQLAKGFLPSEGEDNPVWVLYWALQHSKGEQLDKRLNRKEIQWTQAPEGARRSAVTAIHFLAWFITTFNMVASNQPVVVPKKSNKKVYYPMLYRMSDGVPFPRFFFDTIEEIPSE